MITSAVVLYMRDNTGAMREWAISAIGDTITIAHGQVHGSKQYQTEVVSHGKATRSLDEQIMSRMASRISKQRDKGYINDYDKAMARKATNTLGLPKPMLAQKIANVKNIDWEDAIIQPKFDGNRCMIYCINGVNRAYTRNGKPIFSIRHILDDLALREGEIVDGELYAHGYPLQTIVSWVKREQENTRKLKYHLYDIVSNSPYKARSELIRAIPKGESIMPVYGKPCGTRELLTTYFNEYREDGYEGAILRQGQSGYEDGKRSKSLIKVKTWLDDEFEVLDVFPSRDGWAILECITKYGNKFRVSAPGTIDDKTRILEKGALYIGRWVTVEYANLTKDGVPFHPVAINFRDPIQG